MSALALASIATLCLAFVGPLADLQAELGGNATQAWVHTICGLYLPADEGEPRHAHSGFPRRFAEAPSVAVELARRFVYKSLDCTLEEMLDYEAVASVMTAATLDAKEGTASFMEKRDAKFIGQ